MDRDLRKRNFHILRVLWGKDAEKGDKSGSENRTETCTGTMHVSG